MDNYRINLIWVVVVLFTLLSAFYMGRNSVKPTIVEKPRIVYDTITRTKIVHDTMWRDRIVYRDMPVVVRDVDTIRIVDTVEVAMPIYNYQFKDDLYDIRAEGYEVKLNSVTVYPRTEYKVERVEVDNRWGLGIHAGYGVNKDGLSPYIGVGVSYNLFTW